MSGKNERVCHLPELPFWFYCVDGHDFHPHPRCCDESGLICTLFSDEFEDVIPIDITRKAFTDVNYFCKKRSKIMDRYVYDDNLAADKLEEFDSEFLQKHKSLTELVDLCFAAFSLEIDSLLVLTRTAIVDLIDRRSLDEILKIFRIPGFTIKDMEMMKDCYPWAFNNISSRCREDDGKPKSPAANFSSPTLEQKHEWITATVIFTKFNKNGKMADRMEKKMLVEDDVWFSYLIKEEKRMMMGDLDQDDEGNNNLFNQSDDVEEEEDPEFYALMYSRRLMLGDDDLDNDEGNKDPYYKSCSEKIKKLLMQSSDEEGCSKVKNNSEKKMKKTKKMKKMDKAERKATRILSMLLMQSFDKKEGCSKVKSNLDKEIKKMDQAERRATRISSMKNLVKGCSKVKNNLEKKTKKIKKMYQPERRATRISLMKNIVKN